MIACELNYSKYNEKEIIKLCETFKKYGKEIFPYLCYDTDGGIILIDITSNNYNTRHLFYESRYTFFISDEELMTESQAIYEDHIIMDVVSDSNGKILYYEDIDYIEDNSLRDKLEDALEYLTEIDDALREKRKWNNKALEATRELEKLIN